MNMIIKWALTIVGIALLGYGIYELIVSEKELWVVFGEHDQFYNPYPLNSLQF